MNLVLNTTQKLLMSQKMLQSTMILQMSSAELAEYVSTLTEENPLLEFNNKNGAEIPIDNIRRKKNILIHRTNKTALITVRKKMTRTKTICGSFAKVRRKA